MIGSVKVRCVNCKNWLMQEVYGMKDSRIQSYRCFEGMFKCPFCKKEVYIIIYRR